MVVRKNPRLGCELHAAITIIRSNGLYGLNPREGCEGKGNLKYPGVTLLSHPAEKRDHTPTACQESSLVPSERGIPSYGKRQLCHRANPVRAARKRTSSASTGGSQTGSFWMGFMGEGLRVGTGLHTV